MAKPRKMFTLKGSEDGVIGVYSNAKLALESAINYASSFGRKLQDKYSVYYTYLLKHGYVCVEAIAENDGFNEWTVSAEINKFYLNDKFEKFD